MDARDADLPTPFHSTHWTVVRAAAEGEGSTRSRALERLIEIYWRPVYWTLRRQWGLGVDDARDLTQEYFARFLDGGARLDVNAERGRFRSWMKATIRHFMLNYRRDANRLRRGGSAGCVPLDAVAEVATQGDATSAFERELMRGVIDLAVQDLDAASREGGFDEAWAMFRAFYVDTSQEDRPSYERIRTRFGLGEHDVKNRLAAMRRRFRDAVLARLRDGMTSDDELVAEIREVFGS